MNAIIQSIMRARPHTIHQRFRWAINHVDQNQLQRDLRVILPSIPVNFNTSTYINIAPQLPPQYLLKIFAWGSGANTNWHNHGSQMCTTTILQGQLVELLRRDFTSTHVRQTICKPGSTMHITDMIGIHSVHNVEPVPAYSLQLCTPLPFDLNFDSTLLRSPSLKLIA